MPMLTAYIFDNADMRLIEGILSPIRQMHSQALSTMTCYPLPREFVGKPFSELFTAMTLSNETPIALYRYSPYSSFLSTKQHYVSCARAVHELRIRSCRCLAARSRRPY